jgi:hypothetical protein
MSEPKGKSRRANGPRTEPLPPVAVAPEFRTNHACAAMPQGARVLQRPPKGWMLQILRTRVFQLRHCPFCGEKLEAQT